MTDGTPTILLVEDNEDDVLITRRALAKSGASVNLEVARTGAEALDLLLHQGAHADSDTPRPSLVLLDINMPGVTGFDVLEALKSDPERRRLPVVMLTSSIRDADVRRAYDLGANSYLIKPVDYGEFVEMLNTLVRYWFRTCALPGGSAAPSAKV